jgi:hypothetical protein
LSPLAQAVSGSADSAIGVRPLVVRCSKAYREGMVGRDAVLPRRGHGELRRMKDQGGIATASKETDMFPRTTRWLPAMVFLAGGLAACDRHAPQRVATADDGAASSLDLAIARVDEAGLRLTDGRRQDAAEMQASMQDAAISARVNAAMMSDPQLSGSRIEVSVQQGAVTLRGSVPDALAIARAAELASGVEGVTSVVNELKVSTT